MQTEKIMFIKGDENCDLNEINDELKKGLWEIEQIIPQYVSASTTVLSSKVYGGFIVHLVRVK